MKSIPPNIQTKIQAIINYLVNFKWEKIIKWFGFNLFIAGAPLFGKYLLNCQFMSSSCKEPTILLFGQGDLILLSCAILAESLGDLLQTKSHIAVKRISYALISIVLVITFTNAFLYGSLDKIQKQSDVINWSIKILIVSIGVGLTSKFLGED